MKKSQFMESQIVAILKEADAGLKVADVCRKHGICGRIEGYQAHNIALLHSQPTYYNWKSK